MTVLFIFISCSQKGPNQVEQRILRIGNGLVEIKSPAEMLQPDTAQSANPKTLKERMEHHKVPGVSIAVINGDRIEWTKAYGTMDVNTGAPVTTETIFEAASTSKFITSVLALNFVQRGLIDLDTNVNDYLTSWKVPDNEFTKREKVTLRRILTHRAGMPTTNFDYDEDIGIPSLVDVLNGRSPAENKPAIPEVVPGSQWQYSNVAYDIIQLLLEDITGKPFQTVAEEIVFEPLGMTNSTFVYPLDSEKKKREAMPHDAKGISREPAMHESAFAHGNLTTTPTDLAKFSLEMIRSYQGKSDKVLAQRTAKQLFNKECEIDQKAIPLPFYEGLGVFLMGEGKDLVFTHPGENYPGFISWLIGWPERGTAAIIMTNGAQGHMLAMEIVSAIHREYNKTNE
jgi:CubicO group peptidase (beta-lactamase class C family)